MTVALVTQTISDLYFTVNVQGLPVAPQTLLRGVAAGVLASLGAACLPALEATRIPPAGAMLRSGLEQRARWLLPRASAAAIVLAALGVALLRLPDANIRFAFIALTAFIIGGALLAPLALNLLLRGLTPLTGRSSASADVWRRAPCCARSAAAPWPWPRSPSPSALSSASA